jgi:proteasome lid subunit RPN8/RPN11
MSQKAKPAPGQPHLLVDVEVVRKVRQHARTSMKSEICGVLIGHDRPGQVEIEACIPGENAEEAGTHVTFTQDTWEHIYQIKDQQYPEARIVGWYHSHPGFGVFLSEHDVFIHKNFFASPGQVAWVFDPHSDEEGCFVWVEGEIERSSRISLVDRRGGEPAQEMGRAEPAITHVAARTEPGVRERSSHVVIANDDNDVESSESSLLRLATNVFSYLTVFIVGLLIAWYVFPRIEVLPVPVDPATGQPLAGYSPGGNDQGSQKAGKPADAGKAKGKDGQPR